MRGVFIAAGVALAVSILLTPYLIRFFSLQGFGQEIREEGPQRHKAAAEPAEPARAAGGGPRT